jgi:tetratricopeptide (TPR) repeat protein
MWFQRGQSALAAGQPRPAIQNFRDALYYSHDNRQYRLRLAEALVAAGRIREAQSYLLTLWQDEPSNSTVNLQLARLAARQGETQAVLRYYHGAIYGLWSDGDAASRSRQARLELINYLLSLRNNTQADAELIALTSELPANAASHTQVGWLFLRAGDQRQALTAFEQALRFNPRDASALLGAGQSAFDLAEYSAAARYLERAVHLPHPAQAQDLLATCRLVLEWNPNAQGVNSKQRALRIVQAFHQAGQRLKDCAAVKGVSLVPGTAGAAPSQPPAAAAAPVTQKPPGLMAKILGEVRPGATAGAAENKPAAPSPADMQQLYEQAAQLKPEVRVYRLQRDPQTADAAMNIVTQIETLTAQQSGRPKGPDLALFLLAQKAEER